MNAISHTIENIRNFLLENEIQNFRMIYKKFNSCPSLNNNLISQEDFLNVMNNVGVNLTGEEV